MISVLADRDLALNDDEFSYLDSFGINLSRFMLALRSHRVQDLAQRLDDCGQEAGVSDEVIYGAIDKTAERIWRETMPRDKAITLLTPLLEDKSALAGAVYDYVRVMQAVSMVAVAYAINRVGIAEPADPTLESTTEALKAVLRDEGHGPWEAAKMAERLHTALEEHSKDYLSSQRGR